MKKIYLTGGLIVATLFASAQTTYKILKKDIVKGRVAKAEKVIGNPSLQQVSAVITCGTQYVAGTTMNLQLNFTTTNTDLEYGDFLAITFPAGITPTGLNNTSNPFPNTEDPGGGLEALNPVAGQVISWGNAAGTDEYGGIFSSTGIGFTVEVTVAPGLTGAKTATWTLDGDGYNLGTGGVGTTTNGSFVINPAGTPAPDLTVTFVQPYYLTSTSECNYGVDTIVGQIKNIGNTPESNISVNCTVNGVAIPAATVVGPLAPGDSAFVVWLPGYDFSATNTYNLVAYTALPGDINLVNDTVNFSFSNHVSIPLTSTTYTNGIETAQDVADISISGTAAPYTGLSGATFHTGAQALFTTVGTNQPAGTYQIFIALPCMNVVAGETYRISYWRKVNNNPATHQGSGGIFTGLSNDGTTMTALKAYSPITPTGPGAANWTKDSVDYVATATEIRYFAIGGQGTVNSTTSFNFRVDDIKIIKLAPPVAAITASSNTVCVGQAVTLTDASANTPTSWSWSMVGGNPASASTQNSSVTYNTAGTYTVVLNASNSLGSDSAVSVIVVNAAPNITASSNLPGDSLCSGGQIILSGSGGNSYTWTGGVSDNVAFSPSTTQTYTVTGTGSNGCTNTASITVVVDPCLNISAYENFSGIKLFPNPSNGIVNVQLNAKEASLEVYDVLGNSVVGSQKVYNGNNTINLNELSSGVYFVRVNIEGKVITNRISINKQ